MFGILKLIHATANQVMFWLMESVLHPADFDDG